MRIGSIIVLLFVTMLLSSCSGKREEESGGGYFGGDRPPSETRDFDKIPDAIPRIEPRSNTGNKPYQALGKEYIPLKTSIGFAQTGTASWYGKKFHGRRTSSGEPYDMWAMTAAHPVLPLPTYVRVTSLDNGKEITVKVNDRGPFLHDRIIDLSYAAAHKLGIANRGTGRVKIVALDPAASLSSYVPEPDYRPQSGVVGELNDVTYYVQVGAFSDKINVMAIRDKIITAGFQVFPDRIEKQFSQQAPPYKVKVGPYIGIAAAQTARLQLEAALGQHNLILVK